MARSLYSALAALAAFFMLPACAQADEELLQLQASTLCVSPVLASPETDELAKALANYAIGIIREATNDDRAGSNFAAAVASAPDSVEPYFHLALSRLAANDRPGALQVMREATERLPNSSDARYRMAALAALIGDSDAVEYALTDAVRLAPTNTNYQFKLAMIILDKGREEEAITRLENALSLVDDKLQILRFLGDFYENKVKQGDQNKQHENLMNAIVYLERAAEEPPDSQTEHYAERLGALYIKTAQFSKAIALFQRLAQNNPSNKVYWQRMALAYAALGNSQKLIECIKLSAPDDGSISDVETLMAAGDIFEAMGDFENAEASFVDAICAEPANVAPVLRFSLFMAHIDTDAAIHALEQYLLRVPENQQALEALAHFYAEANRIDEAMALLEKTRSSILASGNKKAAARFFIKYGILAEKINNSRLAEKLFLDAIIANPEDLASYLNVAFYFFNKESPKQTHTLIKRAIKRFRGQQEDITVRLYLAIACSQAQFYQEAALLFEQVQAMSVGLASSEKILDARYYFNYGATCERLDEFDKAVELLKKAIELDSEHADALNYLAYIWAEKGKNLDEALLLSKRALNIDPENAAYIDTLGWIFYQQGLFIPALRALGDAHKIMPDDPTILEHLGDAYAALELEDSAISAWLESLLIEPDNEAILRKLAEFGVEPILPNPSNHE